MMVYNTNIHKYNTNIAVFCCFFAVFDEIARKKSACGPTQTFFSDGNGRISTPTARQKLSFWGIKDLGEIYLFLMALASKMRLWTQKLRSLDPKTILK